MICKFHASMNHFVARPLVRLAAAGGGRVLSGLALTMALAAVAHAERSDRLQKPTIESDAGGQLDLQKQVVEFSGNVTITQGTMIIRAAKVEVRQLPSGYYTAVAFGSAGKRATFRQKRDGVDEFFEGEAERLEYDGKSDTVKFINRAELRRLRGATPADEVTGNLITYDATTEKMNVSGGAAPTAANPNGRVRAVLTPREGSEAAAEAASATQTAPPLRQSPTLAPPASAAEGRR